METFDRARDLWEEGAERLMAGDVSEAVELFNESLSVEPTAEGYTYRGWASSYLGDMDEAIADCKRAIRLDPEFGNAYNDIGVYLVQQGKLDDAIPWLESAKRAKRYEARHFPYLNLGKIYLEKGEPMRALDEFVFALEINPNDPEALEAIGGINYSVN